MTRRTCLQTLAATALAAQTPAKAGFLRLRARTRDANGEKEIDLHWKTTETAIIVCDMWNGHYCGNAARRVTLTAPRMNEVLKGARSLGVTIIHSPSGTMDVYTAMDQRKRMIAAKAATPPVEIGKWCYFDPKAEAELPIDDKTQPCDDDVVGAAVKRFDRQHPALEIFPQDGISDSGVEIYNYFEEKGITNVALMGVHLNMCVLGRPFGIRQMVRLGKKVVLARDLTDAMYDPKQRPWVSHERGTELMVYHVERHWCPSVLGEDLTRLAVS
ncbi:MAG: protein-signal peptide and transmembrane prediction [Bryobacteraceae bacterium]